MAKATKENVGSSSNETATAPSTQPETLFAITAANLQNLVNMIAQVSYAQAKPMIDLINSSFQPVKP